MGAGALAICHGKSTVQIRIREDMKKMVQLPVLKNLSTPITTGDSGGQRVFGVSLMELNELGLVKDGVPLVLRSMVEYLRQHGLEQEGLFRVSASVRAVESLKQRLDSGEVVDLEQDSEVCTVAGLLKQYLRELPEGLVHSSIHNTLVQLHDGLYEEGFCCTLRELLLQMPAVHYNVLRHLCHFLTQVEQQQSHNRMTAFNLATVFGPNVFHVSPGFEGMQEQNICNKIMAKLIQNYWDIFEPGGEEEQPQTKPANVIMVKEAHMDTAQTQESPPSPPPKTPVPVPRKKKATQNSTGEDTPRQPESKYETPVAMARKIKASRNSLGEDNVSPRRTEQSLETPTAMQRAKKATQSSGEESASPRQTEMNPKTPVSTPRKKKVKKAKSKVAQRSVPQPAPSTGLPFSRHLSQHPTRIRSPSTEPQFLIQGNPQADSMDLYPPALSPIRSTDALSSSQEETKSRPISPFYVSSQLSPAHHRPDLACYLEKTIRSAVEQHLFDGHMKPGQGSHPGSESASHRPFPVMTARQRRRQQREQEESQERCRDNIDKENIPSHALKCSINRSVIDEHECRLSIVDEGSRTRNPKHSPTLTEHSNNPDSLAISFKPQAKIMLDSMDHTENRDIQKTNNSAYPETRAMKIQEALSCPEPSGGYEDIPRLDLSALTEDSNWGDPVPAYSSWQRETMDNEEARLSPQSGGKMIRQLLEEDSDPMVSPRFYAYGNSQQYLDDTEVPPSPPNTHSFVSRRRSSSLGSCDNEREELTSTQLTKKIHNLKKKIHKFEERFEEERKYRPSHGDKAANPEVLRWMNELAKLRKDLKEHHLQKSEEDLAPLPRQRSNTLPKSFGSQLEKKVSEPKAPKPPVENTLEAVMNKLQEKRTEAGRPEDIKDMTREQIGAEKVALQKALLYYEGIHGRPITKTERQLMKPLYDRYRLVKQILCRASTIPVIEEEDGSDDDNDNRTQFAQLTVRPELSVLGLLEHLDEDTDGFISPVDELSPSKNTTDMRLSNLHAATIEELVEQLQEAREEKKRIRKNLREFEDEFFRQNGRNVQKEDRSPLAEEYNEYKHIKAKLRLLEVLISKRDSSKFI